MEQELVKGPISLKTHSLERVELQLIGVKGIILADMVISVLFIL